jgi:hypothetical protein
MRVRVDRYKRRIIRTTKKPPECIVVNLPSLTGIIMSSICCSEHRFFDKVVFICNFMHNSELFVNTFECRVWQI